MGRWNWRSLRYDDICFDGNDCNNVFLPPGRSCPRRSILDPTLLPPCFLYSGRTPSIWNFRFPSKIEQLLRRIACFNIVAFVLITCTYLGFSELLQKGLHMDRVPFWDYLALIFFDFILIVLCALGILSSLYIVVEAFVSLRQVPIGVYATIPHV